MEQPPHRDTEQMSTSTFRGHWERARTAIACAIVVCAGVTCRDGTSPGGRVSFGIAPVFSQAAERIYSDLVTTGLVIDNVHLILNHGDGSVAKDTVVEIVAGQDSVIIEMVIDLNGNAEQLTAKIDLRDGLVVLFSGTQGILASVGGAPPAPPPVTVEYSGPGSTVTSLTLGPADTAITVADSVVYRPIGKDKNDQQVADLALIWALKDSSIGTISSAGVFRPKGVRGQTYVIARTLTSIKDSAHVSVAVPATKVVSIAAISSCIAGATNPMTFESRGADDLPVPSVPINFAATVGGGSVSPASVTTGLDGRVTASFTCGTTLATNTFTAASPGLTGLSLNVSVSAGPPAKLAITQQPSATVVAGTVVATAPKVQLQDQYGNAAKVSGLPIVASLSPSAGLTLTGTTSVSTDANGLSTFSNLVVAGPNGTVTALAFGAATLTGTTSNALTLQLGAPSQLLVEGGSPLTIVAGNQLPSSSAVKVADIGGNGIPGQDVRLVVTIGVTTVKDTTLATDANGRVLLNRVPAGTTAGTYTITATSGSLSGSPATIGVTILTSGAHHLKFGTMPGGTGGVPFGFTVAVVDQFDNVETTSTANVTVAIKAGTGAAGAVLGPSTPALTQAAVGGIATFSLSIDKAAVGYVLTATAPPMSNGGESAPFPISVGPAALLSIVAGDSLGAQKGGLIIPVVKVRDAGSNNVPGATVTFTPASGSGTANGSASATGSTNGSGQASANWNVGTSGTQTLTAAIAGLSVTFHAFLAETLVVVTEPESTPHNGEPLSPQPKVQLRDKAGRQVKLAGVNVTINTCCRIDAVDAPSASLSGTTTTATDGNGESQFADVTLSGVSGVTTKLTFTATSIDPASSALLTMTAGAADHLVFGPMPGGTGGVPFGFTVEVVDALNNRVTTGAASTADVTVAIKSGTGAAGALLSGTLTQAAVAGVATFNVAIDKAAVGYVLAGTSPAAANGGESAAFEIAVGPAAQLIKVAGDGGAALPGNEPSPNPKVMVADAGGNAKVGVTVAFAIVSGSGTLSAPTITTDVNGFAIDDWHLGAKGSGAQSVSASVSGLTSVLFTATLAEKLVIVQDPQSSPQSGIPMSPQPKIQLQNAAGDQAKVAGVSVGAKIVGVYEIPPVLSGTTPVLTDANGEATYTNLTITGNNALLGPGPVLGFGATSVDSAFTGNLSLQAGTPAQVLNWSGDYQRLPAPGTKAVSAMVRDASGNKIIGVNVTFTVVEGICSFGGGSSTTATSGTDGVASATATITTALSSCTIESKYTFPPPPPSCGSCEGLTPLTKYARLFVAPDAFSIWTGAADDDFGQPGNWEPFGVPNGATSVFVPKATGPNDGSTRYPTLYDVYGAKALLIEPSGHLFMNGKNFEVVDSLFADGSVENGGTLVITGAAALLRGTVHGLVHIGYSGECAPTNALVIGAFSVDSLEVNCTLSVLESFPVDIAGQFRVKSGGYLAQTKGTITVGDSAFFLGQEALTGGVLDLRGDVEMYSNCEGNDFNGISPHITRLTRSSGDTLRLRATFCSVSFGVLEINATNAGGAALISSGLNPMQFSPDTLRILKLTRLRLSNNTITYIGTYLSVEDNAHLLLDGTLSLGALVCVPSLDLVADNLGPFSCGPAAGGGGSGGKPPLSEMVQPPPRQFLKHEN